VEDDVRAHLGDELVQPAPVPDVRLDVLREIQEIRWQCAAEEVTASMAQEQPAEFFADFDRRIKAWGRYSHLAQVFDEGIDADAPQTREERFEFGLDCVLDGIAARPRALPAGGLIRKPAALAGGPSSDDGPCPRFSLTFGMFRVYKTNAPLDNGVGVALR
jgi:hypothetical protein